MIMRSDPRPSVHAKVGFASEETCSQRSQQLLSCLSSALHVTPH
jgi:hypothetical protein